MESVQGTREVDHMERPSPLTDTERMMIEESWTKVYENCDDVGVAILIRLFVNFPSAKQYFSQFKHMEEPEELERSTQLRKHAHRVMSAINTLVESLEDSEKVASVLQVVGKAHALRHKVEPVYFKILSGVILEVLGEVYPQVVTPDVGAAWTKLLATVCFYITAVYEEVGWTKLSASTGSPEAGRPWVRTMCTTMMVLTTIALILRQRFSNKIKPQKDATERDVPYMKTMEQQKHKHDNMSNAGCELISE